MIVAYPFSMLGYVFDVHIVKRLAVWYGFLKIKRKDRSEVKMFYLGIISRKTKTLADTGLDTETEPWLSSRSRTV